MNNQFNAIDDFSIMNQPQVMCSAHNCQMLMSGDIGSSMMIPSICCSKFYCLEHIKYRGTNPTCPGRACDCCGKLDCEESFEKESGSDRLLCKGCRWKCLCCNNFRGKDRFKAVNNVVSCQTCHYKKFVSVITQMRKKNMPMPRLSPQNISIRKDPIGHHLNNETMMMKEQDSFDFFDLEGAIGDDYTGDDDDLLGDDYLGDDDCLLGDDYTGNNYIDLDYLPDL